MTKLITCPPLCGVALSVRGVPTEWSLVEYVQDVLLTDALGTAELCEFAIRVGPALPPRGPEQVGKTIALDKDDWKTLCALAAKQRNPGSPENTMAFAACNLAIFRAADEQPVKAAAE
jgi:hypothetical protein